MQETSGYNSSDNNNCVNRSSGKLNEYSFSLKRDLAKAGLDCGDMEDVLGVSGSEDDDEGSEERPEEPMKKTPPPNGKKTKGRVKIKMEFIDNKLRRYTTFSKRKTGIMKKAYELSTLTGTQVMLLVASETGHVYTFATRKLQPMITSEAGKALIQTCLNSPDPLAQTEHHADQRMSATGFEETELTYTITDDDCKMEGLSGKGIQMSGNNSEAGNTQLSLSHMSLPVTSLITSNHSSMAKNNMSMQLPKSHQGFTTLLTPGLSGSNQHGELPVSTSAGNVGGGGLPLMYQSAQGVVYAPTSSSDGVILSLGQSPTVSFSQDTRNSSGQSYITLPVSITSPSHQQMMNPTSSK